MSLITPADFARLRDVRAHHPDAIAQALAERRRRPVLQGDGRLFIIAADHPARGAFSVGPDAMAMGDRYGLLERLALALSHPGVDGVLGTPDIIDDLAVLGVLDDKVVVGSMNRGGLQRARFEMDDRYTAYDVPTMVERGIDFAKALAGGAYLPLVVGQSERPEHSYDHRGYVAVGGGGSYPTLMSIARDIAARGA